ncbi:hypothetical protein EV363DRAFT_927496 [Boletus edulis]|uniref:Uncharacterized protein n=1 Tax=Boletus edulis BED1 TaxID=1328754 RepID=A0AAD4BZ66_BOLED|nr:hypothetical protein EV363DRAFT_927496 [Boletus edulis]KAF8443064.1 hypothetical protein L210DRAFT_1004311 [Boletus edulis BED1]
MERLCDDIIHLIIYELNDPTALILTSKRFLRVSRDPYVRAHYFLHRYGHMDAMFWALGRGKVLNDKVIDILVSSGAYISRYIIQVAIHHYFRSASHFIKTPWVRSIPLSVFTHFMKVTSALFDEIPLGKNEDDGYIFHSFLKESRLPQDLKSTKWEDVREILDKYKFIPFSMKDPLMAQLPIALAIEPRLLPYAEANGFRMDPKYRDFVFRKMFEKQALNGGDRTDEIVRNVRELKRLDPRMFLSRTVAAEICMEAKSNESAYRALKVLDRSGELLFKLGFVVTELMKLFVKSRSITSTYTINVLRQLYTDFPSTDPMVRVVMLLTVCLSESTWVLPAMPEAITSFQSKLEAIGLLPLTREDLFNVMINPFVEKLGVLLEYAKEEMEMSVKDIKDLVQEVAIKCLEIASKGKTLRRLVENYSLHVGLADAAVRRYSLSLDDLTPAEDEKACATYEAALCRDFSNLKMLRANSSGSSNQTSSVTAALAGGTEANGAEIGDQEDPREFVVDVEEPEETPVGDGPDLGAIGQDTLSAMIRQDEMAPTRSRRRSYYYSIYGADVNGKLDFPIECLPVGRWAKEHYDPHSAMMALFMTHAVINNNTTLLHLYLSSAGVGYTSPSTHVPITLKHFKLLAHLGRAPNWCLYHEIEFGAEFFFSEEDYLSKQAPFPDNKRTCKFRVKPNVIKKETSPPSLSRSSCHAEPPTPPQASPSRTSRRRPRRSAATTVTSYIVPDSDDEAIVEDDENAMTALLSMQAKKRKVESNLQRWIKHLSALLVDEQRKYKERRRRQDRNTDGKRRVMKSEFHKSLIVHLRSLRKVDLDKRKQLYGSDVAEEDYSDDDGDDEYQNVRVSKRRRITA